MASSLLCVSYPPCDTKKICRFAPGRGSCFDHLGDREQLARDRRRSTPAKAFVRQRTRGCKNGVDRRREIDWLAWRCRRPPRDQRMFRRPFPATNSVRSDAPAPRCSCQSRSRPKLPPGRRWKADSAPHRSRTASTPAARSHHGETLTGNGAHRIGEPSAPAGCATRR